MPDANIIIRSSAALIVPVTVVDLSNVGVTTGITVKASVYQCSSAKYWDVAGTSFSLSSEPVALATLTHNANGLYELVLTSGASQAEQCYQVHLVVTGTQASDYRVSGSIAGAVVNAWDELVASHTVSGSTGATLQGIANTVSALATGVNVTSWSGAGVVLQSVSESAVPLVYAYTNKNNVPNAE